MIQVAPKLLRDAKAGNYTPRIYGTVLSIILGSNKLVLEGLLDSEIIVLDISFYQDTANFEKMIDNGVRGVIIRAGQNLWIDTKVHDFMLAAERANMPVGSYWYFDSRVEPRRQAEKWKEALGNFKTQLYCWADYEENYGGKYSGWKNLYNFLEACKELMPDRKFGIYTGYYYWLEHSPITTSSLNYFKEYPLWLAWYTNDVSLVKIPKPWTKMLLWQKTSSGDGNEYGVGSKEVDMNLFMGTKEEFESLSQTQIPEDPNNEGEGKMYKVWSDNYNMSLRSGPSINEPRVEIVPLGTDMLVDQFSAPSSGGISGDEWAHVISVNGVSKDTWVAIVHNGATYCHKQELPEVGELPSVLYIATMEDMSDKTKYVKEV